MHFVQVFAFCILSVLLSPSEGSIVAQRKAQLEAEQENIRLRNLAKEQARLDQLAAAERERLEALQPPPPRPTPCYDLPGIELKYGGPVAECACEKPMSPEDSQAFTVFFRQVMLSCDKERYQSNRECYQDVDTHTRIFLPSPWDPVLSQANTIRETLAQSGSTRLAGSLDKLMRIFRYTTIYKKHKEICTFFCGFSSNLLDKGFIKVCNCVPARAQ